MAFEGFIESFVQQAADATPLEVLEYTNPDGYAVTSIDVEFASDIADSVAGQSSVPGGWLDNPDLNTLDSYKQLVTRDSKMMIASSQILREVVGDGTFISVNISAEIQELRDLERLLEENIQKLNDLKTDTALEVREVIKDTIYLQGKIAEKAALIRVGLEKISPTEA